MINCRKTTINLKRHGFCGQVQQMVMRHTAQCLFIRESYNAMDKPCLRAIRHKSQRQHNDHCLHNKLFRPHSLLVYGCPKLLPCGVLNTRHSAPRTIAFQCIQTVDFPSQSFDHEFILLFTTIHFPEFNHTAYILASPSLGLSSQS